MKSSEELSRKWSTRFFPQRESGRPARHNAFSQASVGCPLARLTALSYLSFGYHLGLVLFLCHSFALTGLGAEAATGVNLARNGSFEAVKGYSNPSDDSDAAKPFPEWDCLGGWLGNIQVGRIACDGNLCARFSGECWMAQYGVKVEAGKKYVVSVLVRTAVKTAPEGVEVGAAYLEVARGGHGKAIIRRSLSGVHDWRKLEGVFTVPDDVSAVELRIGGGAGYSWFDDIRIVRVEEKNEP